MKQIMVIMLAGLISSAYAADIYVSLTGDGSDGLSWSTAFTNVVLPGFACDFFA